MDDNRSPTGPQMIPRSPVVPYVLCGAAGLGPRPAVVDAVTGTSLTYARLARGVNAAAAALGRHGVHRGDVVALQLRDGPAFALALYSVLAAGAVATPVPADATVEEAEYRLTDSWARFLITEPELCETAFAAVERSRVRQVFAFGDVPGATPFEPLLEGAAAGVPVGAEADPDSDVAALPYTGGTTGQARGVLLSHRNLVAATAQFERVGVVSGGDTVLSALPLSQVYGMTAALGASLALGATLVCLPTVERTPEPEAVLQALARHRATVALLPAEMVELLAGHGPVEGTDALHTVVGVGGQLPQDVAEECAKRLDCRVVRAYGLTEAAGITHLSSATFGPDAGPPLPHTRAKIVDPRTGRDVPGFGAVGELWLRGPQVMLAYLGRPQDTDTAFAPGGWLRTGDTGSMSRAGNFQPTGRVGG